ncbi:MAG: hypothetical protein A2297_10210 [Elusimicrobia bacterium RIFOXYB2_FULL_48_7]|nr:MAG: hypothetical protein A2297_10210 [Elusimicrobia bacterium RIFOXYB2_FULL_48_7]
MISLVMIVKNEEHNLNKYLHKYEEIIFVDTGSNDSSKEIALKYDAKIYDYQWNDDYAAARNFGLSKATGDWILHLDADEMIDSDNIPELEMMVKDDQYDYYDFTIWNFKEDPYKTKHPKIAYGLITRLFRNNIGIKYDNIVHERLDNSLKGLNGKMAPFGIYHFGFLDKEKCKLKEEYYRHLNEKQVSINPISHRHYYFLSVYWQKNSPNKSMALSYIQKAIECCRDNMMNTYIIKKREIEAIIKC